LIGRQHPRHHSGGDGPIPVPANRIFIFDATYLADRSDSLNACPAVWGPFAIIGEGSVR
jgi:hypothetical protein